MNTPQVTSSAAYQIGHSQCIRSATHRDSQKMGWHLVTTPISPTAFDLSTSHKHLDYLEEDATTIDKYVRSFSLALPHDPSPWCVALFLIAIRPAHSRHAITAGNGLRMSTLPQLAGHRSKLRDTNLLASMSVQAVTLFITLIMAPLYAETHVNSQPASSP